MNIIDRVKDFFKRGGYTLENQALTTINDHDKVNIDPNELSRIERNMRQYKGDYPLIEYINSSGNKKERDYITLNMRKLSANVLAGLVFNEQCEINISDASDEGDNNSFKSAHEFIAHVFEHNDFKKNLARYLEPMYALGGMTVRPYVDTNTNEVEFSWALADAFYPLKSNSNGISEGVMKSSFQTIERGKAFYYTLLEFHEWQGAEYVITNELYVSENSAEIGTRVPLTDMFDDLEETSTIENLTRPSFNYVRPADFNNINPHSPLGIGICDNAMSTLRKINDTYDQFWWEIKMGQRTVFVSDYMLNVMPDENGHQPVERFDPDVNVYKSVPTGSDDGFVKDVTNDIRTEQYISAINQTLRTLEMELKLSVGTFSFDGKSMKTATEVVSENDLTYRTRNDHVHEVEKFIKGVIISTLELAKAYNLFSGDIPTAEHIGIDFDDGVFQDRTSLLQFYTLAKSSGLIPTVEIIQRVFKVSKDTAAQWIDEINNEDNNAAPREDEVTSAFFGRQE